jgi:hypothetical protein
MRFKYIKDNGDVPELINVVAAIRFRNRKHKDRLRALLLEKFAGERRSEDRRLYDDLDMVAGGAHVVEDKAGGKYE